MAHGFIPEWFTLALSIIMVGIILFMAIKTNRTLVAFGVIPYFIYIFIYTVLMFDVQPYEGSIQWRQDSSRTAFTLMSFWLVAVLLNGKVNRFITYLHLRGGVWTHLFKP